jgi:hypothetical protein
MSARSYSGRHPLGRFMYQLLSMVDPRLAPWETCGDKMMGAEDFA